MPKGESAPKRIFGQLKKEWRKDTSERELISNIFILPAKGIKNVFGFLTSTWFADSRRMVKAEVNRGDKVQTKIVRETIRAQEHVVAPQEVLKNGKLVSDRFHFDGKDYRLTPVMKENRISQIRNKNGDKLYHINGFGGNKDDGSKITVIWVDINGKIVPNGAGHGVLKVTDTLVKAISLKAIDEKTGKEYEPLWSAPILGNLLIPHPLDILVRVTGLTAITINYVGASFKCIVDNILGGLCLKAKKILAETSTSMQELEAQGVIGNRKLHVKLFHSFEKGLASLCGAVGGVLKLVGVFTNEVLRVCSAVISSPSVLCGSGYLQVKKQHFIDVFVSLFQNTKDVVLSIPASVNPGNVNSKSKLNTSDVENKMEKKSTIEYVTEGIGGREKQKLATEAQKIGREFRKACGEFSGDSSAKSFVDLIDLARKSDAVVVKDVARAA